MDNTFKNRHIVDSLFLVALLFAFALSAVLIIALGSSIYQRSVTITSDNYRARTATSYIIRKVRAGDENGGISASFMGASPALKITQNINSRSYSTYLYVYEGYLMEIMSSSDVTLSPRSGQRIVEMESMEIKEISSGLYLIRLNLQQDVTIPLYISSLSN